MIAFLFMPLINVSWQGFVDNKGCLSQAWVYILGQTAWLSRVKKKRQQIARTSDAPSIYARIYTLTYIHLCHACNITPKPHILHTTPSRKTMLGS